MYSVINEVKIKTLKVIMELNFKCDRIENGKYSKLTLKEIAERMNVTTTTIHNYILDLIDNKLLNKTNGKYIITEKGNKLVKDYIWNEKLVVGTVTKKEISKYSNVKNITDKEVDIIRKKLGLDYNKMKEELIKKHSKTIIKIRRVNNG